ncbi:polyketide synthase dehydratase domain-containing protein, partial [candidate division KSB1 bacterium]|nr:polyketide synthase dehydratase domain-containing protein [candidate division KSB1 bacterium]
MLCLSAKSEASLRALAQRYADYLRTNTEVSLADVCYTAYVGRSHFDHRLAVVANNAEGMHAKLAAFAQGESPQGTHYHHAPSGSRPKIAFLFTGQGAQYLDMGRELYETQPVFREALNKCDTLLRPYLEVSLLEVLFSNSPLEGGIAVAEQLASSNEQQATPSAMPLAPCSLLDQTRYTQPALFALEYALAQLWQSWGIKPSVVLGHSVGEYAAACVAGMMRLEDAIKLIAARGRLMQALPLNQGAMVAIFAEEEKVQAALSGYEDRVSIAAVNDPTNIVISGEKSAVEAIVRTFDAHGVKNKALTVSHAFHSPLMEPMLDAFEKVVGEIAFHEPRVPVISNLTAQPVQFSVISDHPSVISNEQPATSNDPQSTIDDPRIYYRRHVREAVRFSASMQTLHAQGCDVYLEVGPSPVLLGMGKKSLPTSEAAWLPSLRKDRSNEQEMLTSLAALYVRGIEIDWNQLERDPERRKKVLLPNYPFARERYWVDLGPVASSKVSALTSAWSAHPLLGEKLTLPLGNEVVFALPLSTQALPFLDDHRVYGAVVFPATAYLEIAAAAAVEAFGNAIHDVKNFVIQEALVLSEGETAKLHLVIKRNDAGAASFQIFSAAQRGEENGQSVWRLHAQGQVALAAEANTPKQVALDELRKRCATEISVADYYETMRASGMEYGPNFRGITQLYRGDGEALAELHLPEDVGGEAGAYHLHPALLDACFQILGAALPREMEAEAYLPINVERFQLYREGQTELWCHLALAQSLQVKPETLRGNLVMLNAAGETVAELSGLILKRAGREAMQRAMSTTWQEWLYRLQWQPQALPTSLATAREQRWLILADNAGVGESLAEQITAQGGHCTLVFASEATHALGENRFALNTHEPEAWQNFFAEHSSFDGIVHLWSFSQNVEVHDAAALQLNVSALHLVQAISKLAKKPRLYFVTNDAQKIAAKDEASQLPAATLWGLARTIVAEHPELRCTRIDVDAKHTPLKEGIVAVLNQATSNEPPATSNQQLLNELLANNDEDQIAYRAGTRFVARLVRFEDHGAKIGDRESLVVDRVIQSTIHNPQSTNLQLQITQRGVL